MAIAYRGLGGVASGTNSVAVPYPTSSLAPAAGNLMVICVADKYGVPDTPSGWTAVANYTAVGGFGSAGQDSGNCQVTMFIKEAVGGETGNVNINITGAGGCIAAMALFSKDSSKTWDFVCSSGGYNRTSADPASWVVNGNAAISIMANDVLLSACGLNTDNISVTNEAIAATNKTIGTHTERCDNGTPNGDDVKLIIATHVVSAGTDTNETPTYTMTCGASSTNYPAGGTVMLRLREITVVKPRRVTIIS